MTSENKSVLFLTSPDDPLAGEFAQAIARELETKYALSFFYDGDHPHSTPEWCIAWVCDGDGKPQPWLEHISAGPEHSWFLGTDPAQAMRRAVRIIAAWELPTGKPN